jgi:hypothetical protein
LGKANVKIVKLTWIDEDAQEADVEFEFEGNIYHAFGCPVSFIENEKYEVELFCIEDLDVNIDFMLKENTEKQKILKPKSNSKWSYYAFGQVVAVNPLSVDCGVTIFDLERNFRDERLINEYIYFVIERLDIM